MYLNKSKAFTLIELLVVVAIIALLTGLILTNLQQPKARSRDAKRVSDIGNIELAMTLFFDRCNRYPIRQAFTDRGVDTYIPDVTDPIDDSHRNGCPPGITFATFMSRIPTPPTAGDYMYFTNDIVNNTTPTDYVLRANLETPSVALNDDVDGTPLGLDCADSSGTNKYYCVQPR
jgi:prepilin-type N-terminal cleavage/methylation domain-containing protein